MDDLGATKLDDVLDYVGGVSRQNNFGGLWDNIVIRGLPGDQNVGMATLFNGFSSGRGFQPPRGLGPAGPTAPPHRPPAALPPHPRTCPPRPPCSPSPPRRRPPAP